MLLLEKVGMTLPPPSATTSMLVYVCEREADRQTETERDSERDRKVGGREGENKRGLICDLNGQIWASLLSPRAAGADVWL